MAWAVSSAIMLVLKPSEHKADFEFAFRQISFIGNTKVNAENRTEMDPAA